MSTRKIPCSQVVYLQVVTGEGIELSQPMHHNKNWICPSLCSISIKENCELQLDPNHVKLLMPACHVS